jgi:hypothetical protein
MELLSQDRDIIGSVFSGRMNGLIMRVPRTPFVGRQRALYAFARRLSQLRMVCSTWRNAVDEPMLWKQLCQAHGLAQIAYVSDWRSLYIRLQCQHYHSSPTKRLLLADELQFVIQLHVELASPTAEDDVPATVFEIFDTHQALEEYERGVELTPEDLLVGWSVMGWDDEVRAWRMLYDLDGQVQALPWDALTDAYRDGDGIEVRKTYFSLVAWWSRYQRSCQLIQFSNALRQPVTIGGLGAGTSIDDLGFTVSSDGFTFLSDDCGIRGSALRCECTITNVGSVTLCFRSKDYNLACPTNGGHLGAPQTVIDEWQFRRNVLQNSQHPEHEEYFDRYCNDNGCSWMLQHLNWQ